MTRLSAAEYRQLGKEPQAKRNKFGAKRIVIDGITFHSKREGAYYAELKQREAIGEVCDVELQPRFVLSAGDNGEVVGVYRADFRFYDNIQKRTRIIDVKGVETREFRRNLRHIKAQYGITIEVVR